jgi:hypothetical protein
MSFACVASIAAIVSEISEIMAVIQAVMKIVQTVQQMVSQSNQQSMQGSPATDTEAQQLQDPLYRQNSANSGDPNDPTTLRAKFAGMFASQTAGPLLQNFGVNASPGNMVQQLTTDPRLSSQVASMANTLGMTPQQLIGVVSSELGVQQAAAGGNATKAAPNTGLSTVFPSQYEGQGVNYAARIPGLVASQVPSIPTFAGHLTPQLEAKGVTSSAFAQSLDDGSFNRALTPTQSQTIEKAATAVGMSSNEFLKDVAKEVDRIQTAGLNTPARTIT